MKLIHGKREYSLGWRDGCFAAGLLLAVGGFASSFGWGVVVAAVGAVLMVVSRLMIPETPKEPTGEQ